MEIIEVDNLTGPFFYWNNFLLNAACEVFSDFLTGGPVPLRRKEDTIDPKYTDQLL